MSEHTLFDIVRASLRLLATDYMLRDELRGLEVLLALPDLQHAHARAVTDVYILRSSMITDVSLNCTVREVH